ncbi:type 1 glutamine amidotransferase [Streptomyces physcomitrii]|uniref:type 1 glutamine amidotransferase n=1 Tax=Streptomyces physcomitrii TaxID=2724184 RepID=UPI0033E95A07
MSAHHPAAAPRVLVVRNSPRSGPGRLLPWLREEGLTAVETEGGAGVDDPAGYAAVVLLGGGFLPDDDARHPWLPAERLLARRAVEQGVPLLGICLGAQVLAAAHGGTVLGAHGTPERGSCRITLRPEAAADPLLNGLPPVFPAIQNHRDQITELPPGAVHLAQSEPCPVQAFRLRESAWGVQFHPEVGADRLAHWSEAALGADGLDLTRLRSLAEESEPDSARAARQLVANFGTLVRRGIRPPAPRRPRA